MKSKYTKAELEELVFLQLENLNAIHDLLKIIKTQNELLEQVNSRWSKEVIGLSEPIVPYKLKSKVRRK